MRVEDEAVFETTHAKALELVRDGVVDGLRIDHVDGLANPREYLDRLAREGVEHVWVEKILEPGEELRPWPVEGTTGYEFLNDVMHLFLNPAAEQPLTELYADLTGESRVVRRHRVRGEARAGDDDVRARAARACTRRSRASQNLPLALASFHVYRTYVEPERERSRTRTASRSRAPRVSDGLARILLLEEPAHEEFVRRFQQTTGPVMAKGVEDTAFYRYNRFVALNEVGGDAGRGRCPSTSSTLAN